jgi:hypothetical protein
VAAYFNGDVRTSCKRPADHRSYYTQPLNRQVFVVYTQRTSANCFTTVLHFLNQAKVKSMSPHARTRDTTEHASCLLKLSHQYLQFKGQNTACACSKGVRIRCLSHKIKTQITHACISIKRLVYVWRIFVFIIHCKYLQLLSLLLTFIQWLNLKKFSVHCSPVSDTALPRPVLRFCPHVLLISHITIKIRSLRWCIRGYKVLGKILNVTFSTAKLTYTGLELKPGLRDNSLVHNPLNPIQY